MRRLVIGTLVLVLALAMTVPVLAQDPGTGNTNFTVMNLDPAESATVVAEYVNQAGVVDATVEKTLPPLTPDGFPITDSGLPDGWIGSVVVSSDREVTAFGQIMWSEGSSTDGKTAGAYTGFAQGADMLYLPSLYDRDGKQFSRISVQAASSPGGSDVDVAINFFDRTGAAYAGNPVEATIPAGAQETWELGTDEDLGTDWIGSAVVSASGGEIAAAVTTHWKEYSSAYSAVTGGGQYAYLPSLTRRIPAGAWLQYTGAVVQNLDPASDVNVTVYWYDRDGVELGNFADIIPANSSHGYNTRWGSEGSDIPDTFDVETVLGDDWNGSVIIEAEGTGDQIVAIVNLQWTTDHPSGAAASSYYSEASGYGELYAPATFRRVSGSWLQYTGLIVQNVGDASCDLTVTWTDRTGADLLSFPDTIPANASHGYNTKVGGQIPSGYDPADLGDDFRGSAHIEASGCELIAIHNTVWPVWTDSTTYNVYGK